MLQKPMREARFLTYEQVLERAESDVRISKLRLSAFKDEKPRLKLYANPSMVAWHLRRDKLYGMPLVPGKKPILLHPGAEADATGLPGAVWAWWVHDFNRRRLYLAHVQASRRCGMEKAWANLLDMAMREACRFKFREVVVWHQNQELYNACVSVAETFEKAQVVVSQMRQLDVVACIRWRGGLDISAELLDIEYATTC
ncbi:hypothetical protein G7046_g5190 [Stylonectria norvegica]|nr:hypothetical protein G7046_g5190 [Stylonectria norvegica]